MWDCEYCGCQAIAASLAFCPMCGKDRVMPKAVAGADSSNAWEPVNAEGDAARSSPLSPPADAGVPTPAPDAESPATDSSGPDAGGNAGPVPTAPGENGADGTPPASGEEELADERAIQEQEEELQRKLEELRASRNKQV